MSILSIITVLTGQATDLFQEEWTIGNLYSIQGPVNILSTLATWVISFTGICIVIFSILKNAISGLYVVNPKLWDNVDRIKKDTVELAAAGINGATGRVNNEAAKKLGGFLTNLLSYIPNIKELTDFQDDNIDKKQYFAKSIPTMILAIFIGVLIFMGYPAKIANWVGRGGTYVIDAVITNVDPVETVQKISDGITVYQLTTSGSQDPYEKQINSFTQKMDAALFSAYTDMTKTSKQNSAYIIESKLLTAFGNETTRDVISGVGYEITSNAAKTTIQPVVSEGYKEVYSAPGESLFMSQSTGGSITYRYYLNATELSTGSTMESSDDWFTLSVYCTPIATTASSNASLIAFGGYGSMPTIDTKNDVIKIKVNGLTVGDGGQPSEVKGTLGKTTTINFIGSDGNIVESFQASMQSASLSQTVEAEVTLYFSRAEQDRLKTAMEGSSYMQVVLTGSWSKTVGKTQLNVKELRLTAGGSEATFALTTWGDVDVNTTSGARLTDSNLTDFLKASNLSDIR